MQELPNIKIKKGKYRHFKGGEYTVLDVVFDSETCEPKVLYECCETKRLWYRPIGEFFGIVNNEEYNCSRFEEII